MILAKRIASPFSVAKKVKVETDQSSDDPKVMSSEFQIGQFFFCFLPDKGFTVNGKSLVK